MLSHNALMNRKHHECQIREQYMQIKIDAFVKYSKQYLGIQITSLYMNHSYELLKYTDQG